MSLPTRITPAARSDIDSALEWYESIQLGSGDAFADDVRVTIAAVGQTPEQFGRVNSTTRAAPLADHKYIVYYRVEEDCVLITAVMHARANPKRLRRR